MRNKNADVIEYIKRVYTPMYIYIFKLHIAFASRDLDFLKLGNSQEEENKKEETNIKRNEIGYNIS